MLRGDLRRLSDAELLAVCLGTGTGGLPSALLAELLLERFCTLTALLEAPSGELGRQRGLGPARVAQLKALPELMARYHAAGIAEGPVFPGSAEVRGFLRARLSPAPRELFAALFLDARHRLIRFEVLFAGTVDRAAVHPREVLRRALELNAAALILAHNHPSGIPEPSGSDLALTDNLKTLLDAIDVRLLDHLVVGRGAEVSLAERGLL